MIDKKAEIRRCGKEIFSAKGFKDTNISEITKMAGVATGTFYNYYASKDMLFMELFLEENVVLKKEIMADIDLESDPKDVVREIMVRNLMGMNASPILREWHNKEVASRLEQTYREANGLDNFDFLYDTFIEVVKKWQHDGKMRADLDAEMIMALYTAILKVEEHKEEVGIKYFPQLIEYMTEFIMKGLMDCQKE